MAEIDKVKFGKFIAKRRAELGYKQPSLARALNSDTSTIGKIETGARLPSFELFVDLARCLEMTPGQLMDVLVDENEQDHNDEGVLLRLPKNFTREDVQSIRLQIKVLELTREISPETLKTGKMSSQKQELIEKRLKDEALEQLSSNAGESTESNSAKAEVLDTKESSEK